MGFLQSIMIKFLRRNKRMKHIKKMSYILTVVVLSMLTINCQEKKKSDNSAIAAALLASSQPAAYEATLAVVGNIKQADGTAFGEALYVKVEDAPVASSIQAKLVSGTTVDDFTTLNASGSDNGDFSLTIKVSAQSAKLKATVTKWNGQGGTEGKDIKANYTVAIGTFDIDINVDAANMNSTSQVTISGATGLTASVKAVTTAVKGIYSNQNATVGEKVCDGSNLTESPTVLEGDVNGDKTLGKATLLKGTVYVKSGTLTVPPGGVVFGERGSSLFVLPGAKLVANGTAGDPICFTSAQALGSRFPGDWGGIVLIGNGKASRSSQTEGTTPQNYGGGNNDADSSGSLKYAIIEFAGNEVAPGDELNALSMYAVGSGTTLEYVQVHRGLDDGFEWWGGAAGGKYLLATGGLDDDFDMDEGYDGNLQYIIGHKYPATCGGSASTDPHGMEMDGSHINACTNANIDSCGNSNGTSNPTVTNYTMIGAGIAGSRAARHREGLRGNFSKGILFGFSNTAAITCEVNSGFADTQSKFSAVVTDKSNTPSAGCPDLSDTTKVKVDEALTSATAIESAGSVSSDCGFSAKPDYSTKAAYSTQEGGAPTSAGKWWNGWTVFRGR
jgi:hypothetical protein